MFTFFLIFFSKIHLVFFLHIDTLNYQGLNIEYTYNTKFKRELSQLHKMSDAIQPDPLVATQADNSRNASDIVTHKIAQHCDVFSEPDQKKKVVDVVRAALVRFGINEQMTNDILQQFDPSITVQQYRSTYINGHVIQALALIDAAVFQSLRNEASLPVNRNKKFHSVELTPQLFVLMLKKYTALYDDSVRDRFLANVRIFSEKIDRHLALPFEQDMFKSLGHDGCRTLRSIQRNCSFLASEILASEDKQKCMSLEEYSRRPVFKSFKITNKNLLKANKVLETAKETVDLVKNPESLDLAFNCFKCVSAVPNFKPSGSEQNPIRPDSPTGDLALRPPLRFTDTVKAAFNVYRALPMWTRREAEEHLASVHSIVDPRRLSGATSTCTGHPTLIFCDLCEASSSKIVFAATCCLTHRYIGCFVFFFCFVLFFSLAAFTHLYDLLCPSPTGLSINYLVHLVIN